MDYINKDIEKLAYLFCLESYQNEDSPANYMPFLTSWVNELMGDKQKELIELFKDQDIESEDEISDYLLYNPDPDDEKSWKLALLWADFISKSPERMKKLSDELHDYFYWQGELADFYYWLPGCGYSSPTEALQDAIKIFGWQEN